MASVTITRNTMSRIINDIKQIAKSPLTEHGIYYQHDDEDMLKGYALIIGPEDTPYFGGNYFFEFIFPCDYPLSPPVVTYHTNNGIVRFNPNLYINGKVCISILNTWNGEQWTSCQTLSTVLLSLSTLLCANPLVNEPGVYKQHKDVPIYNRIIEHANLSIAVCDVINKHPTVFKSKFERFYPVVCSQFLQNYPKMHAFVKNQLVLRPTSEVLTSTMYGMHQHINYGAILIKLVECHDYLLTTTKMEGNEEQNCINMKNITIPIVSTGAKKEEVPTKMDIYDAINHT